MSVAPAAESLAARLLAPLLALFCGLLPVSAVLLPHWPVVQLWSFGLALPLLARLALGQRSRPDRGLVLALLPFFALALASALWAFEPGGAATLALRSLGTLLVALLLANCFARLPPALARRALRWLLPGFALGLLLLLEELASGLALRELLGGTSFAGARQADHLNRSALGLLLLGFAAAFQLRRTLAPWGGPALLALLFVVLLAFPSSTALLACGVGLALLAIAQVAPAAGRGLLLAGLLLALPLMPLVAWAVGAAGLAGMEELGITARARAHVWDFTLARILEQPWFGWGFDAAPNMPNFGVAPFFQYETKVIPLHPHSGGLQVWLDLGLAGVLLALPPLLLAWRRLAALPTPAAAYGVALGGALLTAASLSFGLWQSRWLGLVFLALLLLRLARRAAEPD
jgi:O-antigen ligase